MKNPYLIPFAALALFLTPGCDRKAAETARHLAELQQKTSEAEARQKDLERQLEEQRIAVERDAIERDRLQIENDRAELERQQGEADAAKAGEIRKREEALARREGKLEQVRADLEEKDADLSNRGVRLDDREQDLAGREALPFQDEGQTEPVGDYGMFYDSLSSYGSWFETPDYGYVWQPVVVSDSNWRPYCRGRWVCTDRGWTWVSDEPFGWATYHYGRWALVRGHGWVWVPGTEWAPCWVSWRENGSHIGWAPLPPETMAYRNHRWDSSVDVQFCIGAAWFTFVEYRYFGSPLYQHCLPLSQNAGCYGSTTNITYIHFENRQVICGGPRYKDVCDRIGRPVPFCRLEIDRHPRPGGAIVGTRPQIKGDRLLVSAPNMDADWNGSLKPTRIKGRMDAMVVERNEPLRPEIADRFKKNREESLRIADRSVQQMGGAEDFRQRRIEQLDENRRQVLAGNRTPDQKRDVVKSDDVPQPADVRPQVSERTNRPVENRPDPGSVVENRDEAPVGSRSGTVDQNDPRRPGIGTPGVYPKEGLRPQQRPATRDPVAADDAAGGRPREPKEQVARPAEQPGIDPQEDSNQRQRQAEKLREEQQQQAAGQQQREAARQRQQDQARQQQDQLRQEQQQQARDEQQRQRQADQTRQRQQAQEETRQQQVDTQRQQERVRQQQEESRRQQEQARQQQEENQRQRQQEQARQQQEENQRQRQQERARQQQEENQRQQEQARQQQEENQRQRQQERARQQQEESQRQQEQARQQQEENQRQQERSRQQQEENQRQRQQQDQKDQEEQRKRNR